MFHRKSKETLPSPERKAINFIELPPEYRSKYEPTLLERKLLEMFSLGQMENHLLRFSNQSLCIGTASFSIRDVFGKPYLDKNNNEFVLPIPEKDREITEDKLENFKWSRERRFSLIKEDLQNLARFIMELKRIEPLLKDDTLFIPKIP